MLSITRLAFAAAALSLSLPAAAARVSVEFRNAGPGQLQDTVLTDGGTNITSNFAREQIVSGRLCCDFTLPPVEVTIGRASAEFPQGTIKAEARSFYIAPASPSGAPQSWFQSTRLSVSEVLNFAGVTPGDTASLSFFLSGSFVPKPVSNGRARATVGVGVTSGGTTTSFSQTYAATEQSRPGFPFSPPDSAVVTPTVAILQTLVFTLPPNGGSADFNVSIDLFSVAGYDALFGSTLQLALEVPEGVTFTSASGFLSQAPAVVPAPPALWLGATAIGALLVRCGRGRRDGARNA
jgi:hypothetical protein